MEWTRLEDEGGYRRLRVEAPWEEVAADYRDLVTRYASSVRLPGFRPGKAPRAAIEQRFRREIAEDLAERAARRLAVEAMREAGAESLGPLEALDIECEQGQPFRAVARYLPVPEFRVPEPAELATPDDGTDPRDRISRRLLELAPFEIPAALVRQEFERDGLAGGEPGDEAWRAAAERMRLMVILKRIARQEGIDVEDGDVERRIAEKAKEVGRSKEALRAELEEGGGIPRLRDLLLAESVLDYLLEAVGA